MAKMLATNGKKNIIGPKIRLLRRQNGLSQEQLMGKLQLMGFDSERGVIKRIENGDRFVSDIELKALAAFFHVSYTFLLDNPLPPEK